MTSPSKTGSAKTTAALVEPRHQHLFERALEKAQASGDVGAYNFLHTCPASHGDRLALELAYAFWRGYGPAVQVDQLWGLDRKVAQRVLAGLAIAVAGDDGPALLAEAAEHARARLPAPPEEGT
jgi:hypothetical protein